MATGLWSMFTLSAPAPPVETEDLAALLRSVLPTFIAIVERTRDSLPEPSSTDDATRFDDPVTRQWKFYLRLYTAVFNLNVALVQWDPAEIVQSFSANEAEIQKAEARKEDVNKKLGGILSELESRFLSRKAEKAGPAFERLGIQRREGETHWKLRALKRVLPANDVLGEDFLYDVASIVRMENKSTKKQQELLQTLEDASDFFLNLQPFGEESEESCPIRFFDYPLMHVSKLTKTLFKVVQTSWCCQCPGNTSHVGRKARLSLTQHQRFEIYPIGGRVLSNRDGRFRILFPTSSRDLEWQDTEIRVNTRDCESAEHTKVSNGLCGVIQGVRAKIRPRMVVYAQELWQLQADVEANPLSSTQLKDAEFVSLKDLLEPGRGQHQSLLSSMEAKDRLILSFILATSLLHFFSGPWLHTSLSSESICFLASPGRSFPDITKPYLTSSCSSPNRQARPRELNQPHRFPDILALGILLLEIERCVPVRAEDDQDRCVVALEFLESWKRTCQSNRCRTVPQGLRRAIVASIDPRECRNSVLGKKEVNNLDVRKYIFERILYPLENALSVAYEVKSNMLHENPSTEVDGLGSFDGQAEYRGDLQEAGKEWVQYWRGGVHRLFSKCEDRCERLTEAARKATRVKVAVLDTGLELPAALQANYEEDERINIEQSESFISVGKQESCQDWRTDCDGHGSQVGQLILRFAPGADLHVAKVFQTRKDLEKPEMATEVHKRISEAINRATNDWKVDMIIMCFGFEEPIPLIQAALDRAFRSEKPPIFFAATRNNGAHRTMAWPAKDMSVIGISSTTGDGTPSTFNPSAEDAYTVFYAFGEGVPVNVAAPGNPDKHIVKYVSGTSFATPIAAALAASLLCCVRMLVETASEDDRQIYGHVAGDLQRMRGMVPVLRRHMQQKHDSGLKSLLPWRFLNSELIKENKLLKDVAETLKKG